MSGLLLHVIYLLVGLGVSLVTTTLNQFNNWFRQQLQQQQHSGTEIWGSCAGTEDFRAVTRHSSAVTRHSSAVTRHSSAVTRHSSAVTRGFKWCLSHYYPNKYQLSLAVLEQARIKWGWTLKSTRLQPIREERRSTERPLLGHTAFNSIIQYWFCISTFYFIFTERQFIDFVYISKLLFFYVFCLRLQRVWL